jgi:uncharacterized protein (DUF305 family)
MKKNFAILTVATALLVSACSFTFNSDDHDSGMMHNSDNIDYSVYDANALMFAQMMIPHHEQAVVMSDLALEISENEVIRQLATEIKGAQSPEIEQMTSWLTTAGAPTSMGMDHNMPMQGMLTDEQLAELGTLSGAEFDRAFLEAMIEHHEGAIVMTQMIENSDNSEVAALATAIITAQQAEIDFMKSLL